MSYQIIQIQNTPHLERTPITQEDVEDILTLLGFPKTDISNAKITVLPSGVTVHWTAKTCEAPSKIAYQEQFPKTSRTYQ